MMTLYSDMIKREILRAGEALSIWEQMCADNTAVTKDMIPCDRYVRRYCTRYEGILCYKTTAGRWRIYKEVWARFLTEGFPDLEAMQPVMSLPTALRYLHNNGFPPSYKLRQFTKDLQSDFPEWIIGKGVGGIERTRITRGHLNKLIGIWYGNR